MPGLRAMGPGKLPMKRTSLRFTTSRSIERAQRSRFGVVRGVVIFLFALLAGRLVYVQGLLRTELLKKADREVQAARPSTKVRYRILDRKGRTLAETVQVY